MTARFAAILVTLFAVTAALVAFMADVATVIDVAGRQLQSGGDVAADSAENARRDAAAAGTAVEDAPLELAAPDSRGSTSAPPRLVVARPPRPPGTRGIAVAIAADGTSPDVELVIPEALRKAIGAGVEIQPALFSSEFRTGGYLHRVLDGDGALLDTIDAFSYADAVLVGRASSSCFASPVRKDMSVCDVSLEIRVYRRGGVLADAAHFTERATAFSAEAAVRRGAELIAERHARRILRAVEG